ncbi:hypothetical protein KIW84_076247 [Lathyrus oleraceus]|uniref:Uncharacterized protein n=1 Tax=Pisum sativum TaxID=3888 RepID=A0A9D5A0Y6_PEA|nr:hypothetical protein KIW84_076247 [Pisum sativum]
MIVNLTTLSRKTKVVLGFWYLQWNSYLNFTIHTHPSLLLFYLFPLHCHYTGAFIPSMADNTRMKELTVEVRCQGEVLEQNESINVARFERMETMQQASESRFAELSTSMEMMLK